MPLTSALRNGRAEAPGGLLLLLFSQRFRNGIARFCYVLLKDGGIAQFPFAFPLQLLQMREIGLRGAQAARGACDLYRGVFPRF
jgi:hypothetical protein